MGPFKYNNPTVVMEVDSDATEFGVKRPQEPDLIKVFNKGNLEFKVPESINFDRVRKVKFGEEVVFEVVGFLEETVSKKKLQKLIIHVNATPERDNVHFSMYTRMISRETFIKIFPVVQNQRTIVDQFIFNIEPALNYIFTRLNLEARSFMNTINMHDCNRMIDFEQIISEVKAAYNEHVIKQVIEQ